MFKHGNKFMLIRDKTGILLLCAHKSDISDCNYWNTGVACAVIQTVALNSEEFLAQNKKP